MQGKVNTLLLNIRRQPDVSAVKLGELTQGQLVEIVAEHGEWLEIRFAGQPAFVHGDFVDIVAGPAPGESVAPVAPVPPSEPAPVQGWVTTPLLNVRAQPALDAAKVGELVQDQRVDVLAQHGQWYEIPFAGGRAFVHGDFVELVTPTPPPADEGAPGLIGDARRGDGDLLDTPDLPLAQVDALLLNVRAQPSLSAAKVGELSQGQIVEIVAEHGDWLEIEWAGQPAFIHGDFVVTGDQVVPQYLYQQTELRALPLEASQPRPVSGSGRHRLIATIWNQYGNLLQALADAIGVDVGVAVAVLCVESGGRGFGDDGRTIIRFENHLFWHHWGQHQPAIFEQHFRFSQQASWQGHEFRASPSQPWESFHGNQSKEWRVLDFARSLDDTAALKSISMGAPQILGSNHAKIGYVSPQKMFDSFNRDIRYHIFGLFDFFDPDMVGSLRRLDFVAFASRYNGPGQAQLYGGLLKDHFDIFKGM